MKERIKNDLAFLMLIALFIGAIGTMTFGFSIVFNTMLIVGIVIFVVLTIDILKED